MTDTKSYVNIEPCTTVLSADQQPKEEIMLDQQKITIIYCRLSVEDIKDDAKDGKGNSKADESNSIQNQKELLLRYAKDHGYTNLKVLIDDGYTGTNFNRPGVQEGFELVKQGLVGCWLVKDMSRFGRDYLTVGQYTDIIFPSYDVRFIAVTDGVDSERGDNEGFTAIRNLFNEWYPRDTSKKVRAVFRQKGTSGKHLGQAPFGYIEDPNNPGYWLVDEEAAKVVRHIFALCIDGNGPSRIARMLEKEQVLTVKSYYAMKKGKPLPEFPYRWNDNSVVGILERIEYTGCTCNFKTYSKSFKLKKRLPNAPENMYILEDTQEAIITKVQWDRVQQLRQNKRRPAKAERQGLFSGLLFCADCGNKLHFATCKSFEGKQDHYVCSSYKSNRGTCSAHYIREDTLRDLVLERILAVNAYIRSDVNGFKEEWLRCRQEDWEEGIREDKRRVAAAKKRCADLDILISHLYEDFVLGNLPMERYRKMSAEYEAEQKRLQDEIAIREGWVEEQENMSHGLDGFVELVNKYVDMTELTQAIVNEYIRKIEVFASDKSSGKRKQKIKIFWNFVDELDLEIFSQPIVYERITKQMQKTA
ncbi:recombinase family protein [Congzhengia minquanensis]|uniref:DUF4368 domain-containing protein n=1 Tax=Congzhengia minquanensis TaxID=2763657 RepID=A0A926DNF6_9FIRM|nr:recombinase family protein [Congzhengia minquanensis]MBC8540360.1 DUF4368 domain-containing protein [Congzhengia minquanensis]